LIPSGPRIARCDPLDSIVFRLQRRCRTLNEVAQIVFGSHRDTLTGTADDLLGDDRQ
jgi:hypothetical protein